MRILKKPDGYWLQIEQGDTDSGVEACIKLRKSWQRGIAARAVREASEVPA